MSGRKRSRQEDDNKVIPKSKSLSTNVRRLQRELAEILADPPPNCWYVDTNYNRFFLFGCACVVLVLKETTCLNGLQLFLDHLDLLMKVGYFFWTSILGRTILLNLPKLYLRQEYITVMSIHKALFALIF